MAVVSNLDAADAAEPDRPRGSGHPGERMPRTRLIEESGKPAVEFRRVTAADAIGGAVSEQRRLTTRDRHLIGLLAEHGVLTTDQLARLAGFDSLTLLARRGVLARFRRNQRPGSQAWRYTLGVLGAILHAASTGQPLPTPARVAERSLSLAASPRLDHQLAVAEVFAALAGEARAHPGNALAQWWPERRAAAACGGIARPDAAGEWAEHGRTVPFWLELDRGTEPLCRVVGKLAGYRQLADAGLYRPALLLVPTAVRERHLHAHPGIHAAGGLMATAAADHLAAGLTPADAVWLRPRTRHRVRLIDLGPHR